MERYRTFIRIIVWLCVLFGVQTGFMIGVIGSAPAIIWIIIAFNAVIFLFMAIVAVGLARALRQADREKENGRDFPRSEPGY